MEKNPFATRLRILRNHRHHSFLSSYIMETSLLKIFNPMIWLAELQKIFGKIEEWLRKI